MSILFGPDKIPRSSPSQSVHALPTKQSANEIFWGLKDRFWMQIIDGEYHQFGQMVFDEGLHNGPTEPGFLASLNNGCKFASEHLTEPLTVNFYKELHKKLCSHFQGEATSTEMEAEHAGKFRDKETSSRKKMNRLLPDTAAQLHYDVVETKGNERRLHDLKKENYQEYQRICDEYPAAKKWMTEWEKNWKIKVEEINAHLSEIAKILGIPEFTRLEKTVDFIYVYYEENDPLKLEEAVQKLFEHYNQTMQKINLKLIHAHPNEIESLMSDKFTSIALLYQTLEWLHPFPDGQGRTDLVLLAKILSEEGFNPAILYDPYMSSWSLPDEWKEYLSQGMLSWQKLSK